MFAQTSALVGQPITCCRGECDGAERSRADVSRVESSQVLSSCLAGISDRSQLLIERSDSLTALTHCCSLNVTSLADHCHSFFLCSRLHSSVLTQSKLVSFMRHSRFKRTEFSEKKTQM